MLAHCGKQNRPQQYSRSGGGESHAHIEDTASARRAAWRSVGREPRASRPTSAPPDQLATGTRCAEPKRLAEVMALVLPSWCLCVDEA